MLQRAKYQVFKFDSLWTIIFLMCCILFCAYCLFNPILIITILFFGLTKGMSLIFSIYCKIQDSKKLKKITAQIDNEIQKQRNQNTNVEWKYGRDISWIEVKLPYKN